MYRKLFERETAVQNLTVHALSTLVFRLMSELELVHSSHHKQRLAQHLGTTREVIARLLGEYVTAGLVKTQRGAVTIKDLFGLRKVVGEVG